MQSALLQILLGCLVLAYHARAEEIRCPASAAFNGCVSTKCISVTKASGQQVTVCDKCGDGYELVHKGTAQARCDCAPGYGVWLNGKYTDYICKQCPEGTQIASGGSKLSATCLSCPSGTYLGNVGGNIDCVCPAGYYRAPKARPGTGLKPVECRPCTSLKAYTSVEGNVLSRCGLCSAGKVANTAHTACVASDDPDAAKPSSTDGTMKTADAMSSYSAGL